METTDDFDLDLDQDVFEQVIPPTAFAPTPQQLRGLVVTDDPDLSRICSRALGRLDVRAEVVWTGAKAMDLLADLRAPLAFAFVDLGLRDGCGREVAAHAETCRPAMHLVLGSPCVGDVLISRRVALCTPFTQEQFLAAFDAALLEERVTASASGVDEIRDAWTVEFLELCA